jgi:beta-lactam-binding protein with PASTA domain
MKRWRRTAAALLTLAGLALGQPPAQATAPAHMVGAPAPLSVEPTSGRSGALVTITSELTQGPTTCTLEQDGKLRQTYPCGPKTAIQFTVSGEPGQHTLTVCAPACDTVDAVPNATAVFTVLSVVPSLIGLTESDLPKALGAARLRLGTVTGPPGSPVVSQYPPGGSAAPPDSQVDVGLGVAPTTSTAVVPELHGLRVARARAVVGSVGLKLRASSSDGYVQSQDPAVGTTVAAGTAVTVTVRSRVTVRFVQVPDVRGDSVDAARQRLAGVGLVMASPSTTGTVATQDLPAGRRVAAGTTVTVTLELVAAPTSTTTSPKTGWYWATAAAALVLLALAGGFGARRLHRRRRQPRPTAGPPPRVTCRATVDTVDVTSTGPIAPTVDVRVREHATLTMERKP